MDRDAEGKCRVTSDVSEFIELSPQRAIEDPHAEIQRQRNAIADGETLLAGKMSPAKRGMVERGVASSKAKLAVAEGLVRSAVSE